MMRASGSFDTAPQYGLGRSELRFAEAIATVLDVTTSSFRPRSGRLLLDCEPHEVTPEAFVDVPQKRIVFDYTYDGVMRSYEASKTRLGVDAVPISFWCMMSAPSVRAARRPATRRCVSCLMAAATAPW